MFVKTLSKYKKWTPIKHSVIKDDAMANEIHTKGYVVIPFLIGLEPPIVSFQNSCQSGLNGLNSTPQNLVQE